MFASSKRPREEDALHQSIPEKKKHRPLSLQTIQPLQKPPFSENSALALHVRPPALTPVESDEDDGPDNKRLCNTHPFLASESPMDLDAGRTPHVLSHGEMSPWAGSMHPNGSVQPSPIPHTLVNQSLNITSPTWRNFPANMLPPSDMEVVPVQHMDSGSSSLGTEWSPDAWWDRRRLPSPISEDEESLAKSRKSSDGGMSYNATNATSPPWDHFPAMDQPSQLADSPSDKKKVTFSMGYRSDCEKCRQKVPGHYSHILRA